MTIAHKLAVTVVALLVFYANGHLLGLIDLPRVLADEEDKECKMMSGGNCIGVTTCSNTGGTIEGETYKSFIEDLDPYHQCNKSESDCCLTGSNWVQCKEQRFYSEPNCPLGEMITAKIINAQTCTGTVPSGDPSCDS